MSGPAQRILVSCEAFRIEPLFDRGLQSGGLMRGGQAFRYYRVVNKRDGTPRVNAAFGVTGQLFGSAGGTRTYSFGTDPDGIIIAGGASGMKFPFDAHMTAPATLSLK